VELFDWFGFLQEPRLRPSVALSASGAFGVESHQTFSAPALEVEPVVGLDQQSRFRQVKSS